MIQTKAMMIGPKTEKQRRRYVQLIAAAIGVWALLFKFGQRLPYIRSELFFEVRAFGIFPVIFLGLIWFIFFHQWSVSGKSGFQMAMDKEGGWSSLQTWVKAASGLAGSAFLAGFAAWSCVLIPAWYSQLFASKPMHGIYRVTSMKSASNFREATLIDQSNGVMFTLPIATSEFRQLGLRRTDIICIRGRTTFTGAIAESITKLTSGDKACV